MVAQYGNWMFVSENPHNEGTKDAYISALNEDMKQSAKENNLDFSNGKVEYIFKKVQEDMKLHYGFNFNDVVWTAAWKVTI